MCTSRQKVQAVVLKNDPLSTEIRSTEESGFRRSSNVLHNENEWRQGFAMMILGYVRVSTNEQDTAAQVSALKSARKYSAKKHPEVDGTDPSYFDCWINSGNYSNIVFQFTISKRIFDCVRVSWSSKQPKIDVRGAIRNRWDENGTSVFDGEALLL